MLVHMERVIVEYALPLSSISDQDVLEAADLLSQAYETESRGVIYEPSAANPLAQALFRDLRSSLEQERKRLAEAGFNIKADQLQNCAEALKAEIRYHLRSSTKPDDYLKFAARNHPDVAGKKGGDGLIVSA